MTKTIAVADLYGLGGLSTSPGMLTLAGKIKTLGDNFVVLGPYDQDAWQQAAADLAKRSPTDLLAATGYSLGGNNIVEIAAALGHRKVDFLSGVQASFWGAGVDWTGAIGLPTNVGFALSIFNPSFAATFGLGYARYAAPAGFTGKLQLVTTADLHPDVDNDAGVHGLILNGLKSLAGN